MSDPEETERCQWHQSTENPPVFHIEQMFAALRTCDTPAPTKCEQYRTLGVNVLMPLLILDCLYIFNSLSILVLLVKFLLLSNLGTALEHLSLNDTRSRLMRLRQRYLKASNRFWSDCVIVRHGPCTFLYCTIRLAGCTRYTGEL